MKRFALAGLVALAVTFAAQQSASANCGWYWRGNVGLNLSWDAVMGTFSNQGCCYGYPGGYPYPPPLPPTYGYAPAYGYAPPGYYPQPYAAPNYGTPAPPAQTPHAAPPAPAQQPTTTPVVYYPYSYDYYGYQAPSYWYGR
jgi:hypothetical protein